LAAVNNIKIHVDNIIRKKRIFQALSQTIIHKKVETREKWIRLPHLSKLSFKVSKMMKIQKLCPAFYTINYIGQLLSKVKDPLLHLDSSGVYELSRQDCPSPIGQTGRSLKIRIAEHPRNSEKSPFSAHLKRTNHNFDPNRARLLHLGENGRRLTELGSLEIIKAKNNSDALQLCIVRSTVTIDFFFIF